METKFKEQRPFLLGTAVKIEFGLDDIDTLDVCTFTVDDPTEEEKVDAAAATKEANGVYSYVIQSLTSCNEGEYQITIVMTYGDYTVREQFQIWFKEEI